MRLIQVGLPATVLGVALLLGGPVTTAGAADPIPPDTTIGYVGANVPVWETFDVAGVPGSAAIDHLECRLDDAPFATCTSPWAPTLTGGTHTAAARAVDVDGLADPTPYEVTFFVDTEGPVMTLSLDGGLAKTGRPYVALAVTGSEATTITSVAVSNSADVDADGRLLHAWSGQLQGLANVHWGWALDNASYGGNAVPGLHTVCIQGQDVFGNLGSPACASITLDPSVVTSAKIRLAASENPAPRGDRIVVRSLVEASDGAPIRDGDLSLLLSAPGGSLVADGLSNFVDASDLPTGTYPVSATFSGSSEIAAASAQLSLKIGPAVGVLLPQATFVDAFKIPSWDQAAPFTLGITSRYNAAVSYQCRIDGAAWAACADHLDVPLLGAGSHWAEVRGTDAAGRVQTVPGLVTWRVGAGPGGQWWIQPGGSTKDPSVSLSFLAPGDLTVRVSSSSALDQEGRLAQARVLQPIADGTTTWDLTDPAYGGTNQDGNKPIWVQWQKADGTWTLPELGTVVLDRGVPHLTMKIENGSPFVDRDQLLVLVKSDEPATIAIADDPAKLNPQVGVSSDGLAFLAWPIGDVPVGTVATRTLYAVASDAAHNTSSIVSATVVIDRTSPTTALRTTSFVVGSRVSSTAVEASVGSTSTDSGSGVAHSLLQQTTGGASTVATATSGSIRIARWLPFATSLQFRARAVDRLGHTGAWAVGQPTRPVVRSDRSSLIVWSGAWRSTSRSTALGSTLRQGSAAGASATLAFTGRTIAIVAPKGRGLGMADVLVDGVRVSTIDLRASTASPRLIVFARAWSKSGPHSVTLRVRGTAGRPTVRLDAFIVLP